jgi:hypothetical protein
MSLTQRATELAVLEWPALLRQEPGGAWEVTYSSPDGERTVVAGTAREAMRVWGNELVRDWEGSPLFLVWLDMLKQI